MPSMQFKKTSIVVTSLVGLVLVLLQARFTIAEPKCSPPKDHKEILSSAIDYHLENRQPIKEISFVGGEMKEYSFVPYGAMQEFLDFNINCCRVLGLKDSNGAIYSEKDVRKFDIFATVEISAVYRIKTMSGWMPSDRRTVRYPVDSCANVIAILAGE